MKSIQESPANHFLASVEKIKFNPDGWVCLQYALSEKTDHCSMIKNISQTNNKLADLKAKASEIYDKLAKETAQIDLPGYEYFFPDNDLILLARITNEKERQQIEDLHRKMGEIVPPEMCLSIFAEQNKYQLQKLADQKILSTKKMEAYHKLSDPYLPESISIRRRHRVGPLVMIVEDDRFTASYAASILNRQYDMIHAKTGEEAILTYIENPPDIIFIDVHLPGLDGHQTLGTINTIDEDAFAIMLSVDTEKTNVVCASSNGAHGFLKKPFSKERLLATVRKSPFIKRAQSSKDSGSETLIDFF